jgi:hypothetical protein
MEQSTPGVLQELGSPGRLPSLPYKSKVSDHRRSYENIARFLVVVALLAISSLYIWGEQIAKSEHVREANNGDSLTPLP